MTFRPIPFLRDTLEEAKAALPAAEFLRLLRTHARNDAQRSAIDDIPVTSSTTLRQARDAAAATGQFTDQLIVSALAGNNASEQTQFEIPSTSSEALLDELEGAGIDGTGSVDVTAQIGTALERGLLERTDNGSLIVAGQVTVRVDPTNGTIQDLAGGPVITVGDLLASPVLAQFRPDSETGRYDPILASGAYRLALSEAATTGGEDTPIGVPPGWTNTNAQYPGAEFDRLTGLQGPKYFFNNDPDNYRNDAFSMFADKSPELIAQTQLDLVEAGYLKEGEFTLGRWGTEDGATTRAMYAAMGEANSLNAHIHSYLIARKADPVPDPSAVERLPYQPNVQRRPSMNELAQDVTAALRQKIGRDPLPGEIDTLVSFLGEAYNRQYQLDERVNRTLHEGRQDVLAGEEPETPFAVTDLDPLTELDSFIDKRFGPQIERAKIDADPRDPRQTLSRALRIEGR